MAAPAPLRRWRSILCTNDGVQWPRWRVYPPATPAGRWRIPKAARQLGGGVGNLSMHIRKHTYA